MAVQQGHATAWCRKGKILLTADSNTHGHWFDEHGVRRGATATDFDAYSSLAATGDTNQDLGRHLRAALVASKIDRPEGWYDPRRRDGTSTLAAKFGLKSASSVYQGMRMVSAFWALGAITLTPSIRRFGGGFDWYPKTDEAHRPIILPFDSTDEAIGNALGRCAELCR